MTAQIVRRECREGVQVKNLHTEHMSGILCDLYLKWVAAGRPARNAKEACR